MIISNLNYVEVVSEKNTVEGGFSLGSSGALANAIGNAFAQTNTFTNTVTISQIGNKFSGSVASSGALANV